MLVIRAKHVNNVCNITREFEKKLKYFTYIIMTSLLYQLQHQLNLSIAKPIVSF